MRIARWSIVVVALVVLGAGLTSGWAPADAFLGARSISSVLPLGLGHGPLAVIGITGSHSSGSAAVTTNAGTLVPGSLAVSASGNGSAGHTLSDQGNRWVSWSSGSSNARFAADSGKTPSAGLGGLWRLMSLSRHTTAAHTSSASAGPRTQHTSTPKPAHRAPVSTSPAVVTAPAATAPTLVTTVASIEAPAAVPPTSTFTSHADPVSGLLTPPSGGHPNLGGGLGTGGNLAHGGSSGSVSATPEPATLLLFATGLGIVGVMRRRRLL